MGIRDLLPHLPGGDPASMRFSFLNIDTQEHAGVVALDAAGALWQFASHHHFDFMKGNFAPALTDLFRLLGYLFYLPSAVDSETSLQQQIILSPKSKLK